MPTPAIYKRLARRLKSKRALLIKTFLTSAAVCTAFVLYVIYPFKIIDMKPDLLLLIVMTGVVVAGEIAAISFTLLSVDFCFRETRSITRLKESRSFWARLGGAVLWFSEWYACWALLCLSVICGALAFSIGVIFVPAYWHMIF